MTIIATADITEDEMEDDPEHKSKSLQEGPIHHKSIFKLAIVEVVANFTVSVGFYLVGSGVRTFFFIHAWRCQLLSQVYLFPP